MSDKPTAVKRGPGAFRRWKRLPADITAEGRFADTNGVIHAVSSPESLKAYNQQCIHRNLEGPLLWTRQNKLDHGASRYRLEAAVRASD